MSDLVNRAVVSLFHRPTIMAGIMALTVAWLLGSAAATCYLFWRALLLVAGA